MPNYVVSPEGQVTSYKRIASARAALESAEGSYLVRKKAELEEVPIKVLIAFQNLVAEGDEELEAVKGFKNKQTAMDAVYPLFRKNAAQGEEVEAPEGTGRGRPSQFRGKTITRNVAENPRRADTHGWHAWELIKDGMTFEQYEEAVREAGIAGGTKHIRHEFNLGRVTIE